MEINERWVEFSLPLNVLLGKSDEDNRFYFQEIGSDEVWEYKNISVKFKKQRTAQPIVLDGAHQLKRVDTGEILQFDCVQTKEPSNQDGTHDVIYILKHQP